jgi:ATP-dependent Lon protease
MMQTENQPSFRAGQKSSRLPTTTKSLVRVFDPAAAKAELDQLESRLEAGDIIGDSAIRMRYEMIKLFADDKRSGMRDLVVGDTAMARRVQSIADTMPNFAQPIAVIVGAIKVSQMTSKPMRAPPILLVGEPGVGKTRFMRELADALNVPARPIALNLCDDIGQIVGHSPSWHGTRVGLLARLLLDSQVACPLIYADELDKIPSTTRSDRPADALISLLEEENSRTFRDPLLDFPMRADRVQWIFSANTLTPIPAPLRDRLLVFRIPALQQAEQRSLVKRRIDIRLEELGTFSFDHDDGVLEALSKFSTRALIRLIDIAIGMAARQNRARLTPQDFSDAMRVLDHGDAAQKKCIGFLSFP